MSELDSGPTGQQRARTPSNRHEPLPRHTAFANDRSAPAQRQPP
ncbi:hypothetical protein [Candidatus Accumulibacter sp. ACC007]|nr:hypothetical protein [Candidatus Accumulibacter sp. ACC007]